MDPTSRFIAALALAGASIVPVGISSTSSAETISELDMYRRCKDGRRVTCEAFLNAFPASRYAADVLGGMVGRGGAHHITLDRPGMKIY